MTTGTKNEIPENYIPYQRRSDKLVSAQLVGTICAVIFGFIATQWNIGNLIASQATTNAELKQQVTTLKEDIAEIKQTLHEIQGTQNAKQERRSQ